MNHGCRSADDMRVPARSGISSIASRRSGRRFKSCHPDHVRTLVGRPAVGVRPGSSSFRAVTPGRVDAVDVLAAGTPGAVVLSTSIPVEVLRSAEPHRRTRTATGPPTTQGAVAVPDPSLRPRRCSSVISDDDGADPILIAPALTAEDVGPMSAYAAFVRAGARRTPRLLHGGPGRGPRRAAGGGGGRPRHGAHGRLRARPRADARSRRGPRGHRTGLRLRARPLRSRSGPGPYGSWTTVPWWWSACQPRSASRRQIVLRRVTRPCPWST